MKKCNRHVDNYFYYFENDWHYFRELPALKEEVINLDSPNSVDSFFEEFSTEDTFMDDSSINL